MIMIFICNRQMSIISSVSFWTIWKDLTFVFTYILGLVNTPQTPSKIRTQKYQSSYKYKYSPTNLTFHTRCGNPSASCVSTGRRATICPKTERIPAGPASPVPPRRARRAATRDNSTTGPCCRSRVIVDSIV